MRFIFSKKEACNRGFTLLELLLYLGLAAAVLSVISGLFLMLLQARIKNQTIREVEQQGAQIVNLVTQTVRNSQEINAPQKGQTGEQLSLKVDDANRTPTIFSFSSGTLYMTEGAQSSIALSSSKITISNLTFSDLSLDNTPGTIRIQFTISHKNEASRNEYDYSQTIWASASLRHP